MLEDSLRIFISDIVFAVVNSDQIGNDFVILSADKVKSDIDGFGKILLSG